MPKLSAGYLVAFMVDSMDNDILHSIPTFTSDIWLNELVCVLHPAAMAKTGPRVRDIS